MNKLDKMISYFSPKTALKREQTRLLLRKFDGASTARRTENWRTSNSSSNTEIQNAQSVIRNRVRDLRRNNPYAQKIISGISSNCVGTGIIPFCEDQNFLDLFIEWANSTECDSERSLNFFGIQALALETMIADGDFLIVRQYDKKRKNPLTLKILESDFIDTTKVDLNNNLFNGIQLDQNGSPKGYWIYEKHPGELYSQSNYVKAEDVIHCFRKDRPGQIRGISWFAAIIIFLKKLSDFEDALLEKQLISNLFVGFEYDLTGDSAFESPSMSLEPGAMLKLPPGKQINFATPPDAADPNIFLKHFLRAIATGIGYPYELLSGNLSEVNFSTAKLSFLEFSRTIDSIRWNIFIPQFLTKVAEWFYEAVFLTGNYNYPQMPVVDWTPPRRVMLDVSKEVPAIRDAVQSGQLTFSEALREQGFNPKTFFKEYASDIAKLDELGIVISSDWRNASKTGVNRTDPTAIDSTATDQQQIP